MKKFIALALIFVLLATFASPTAAYADESNGRNGVWIDFSTATDQDLEDALDSIKQEIRSRLKTKIVLDQSEVTLAKGKTLKNTASVTDLPSGVKAGKVIWKTSDKTVATCQQGMIKAVANGQAIITATCTLTDGTIISNDCIVTVYTPIKSLQAEKKQYDMGIGETVKAAISIQPKDASNTAFNWVSSDSSVASVDSDGTITAENMGTATITASAMDESGKQASFKVVVKKMDDRGKTITNSDGLALTVMNMKETKGSGYFKADSGNVFVLIELQIENNSSNEVSINGTFGFDAYCDDYSVDYSFYADLNTKSEISTTDLAPGRKIKGWKGFEVPQDWKELVVKFTPDFSIWGSGEAIEFVLYNQ